MAREVGSAGRAGTGWEPHRGVVPESLQGPCELAITLPTGGKNEEIEV